MSSQADAIDLLRRFAELPPATEDGQEVAGQLAALRMLIHGLFRFSSDAEVRLLAACALARLDPGMAEEVVPVLIDGLQATDEAHQVYAAYACRSLGPLAAQAVPTLIQVVRQTDHDTSSYHALQALEAVGPEAAVAVPSLIEILHGVGPDTPGNLVLLGLGAAAALGEIQDRAAIPALQACLGLEGDELMEMVKEEASEALAKISG